MPDEEEQDRKNRLNKARQDAKNAENKNVIEAAAESPIGALNSVREKISKHWMILFAAFAFDLFGLIPLLGELSDLFFGILLWLYFGSKKTSAGSNLMGIVMPEFLGSALKLVLFFIPVNVATTLIRISMSQD